MASKNPQTMAKRAREQAMREKRALKAEKKQAIREARAAGLPSPAHAVHEDDVPAPADEPAA